jgi:type VI secretion system protein ImpB
LNVKLEQGVFSKREGCKMGGVQDKLQRVRKPRVHIKYEVETEGAMVEKELPFVVGVMGDFSGDPTKELGSLSDRRFIQIDRDNFNEVMARMAPGLQFRVDNKLSNEQDQLAVNLSFKSMDDFEPSNVVQQVEPLRRLQEKRDKLRDLISKADGSEQLETLLERVLQDDAELKQLANELGVGEASQSGSQGEESGQ